MNDEIKAKAYENLKFICIQQSVDIMILKRVRRALWVLVVIQAIVIGYLLS